MLWDCSNDLSAEVEVCCCAGKMQTTKIGELSDGQKSRIVFGMICMKNPNLLLLDEPTNHLDIEAIDSLAEAIKGFKGGLVLVSHDFRLIDQVSVSQQHQCLRAEVVVPAWLETFV